MGGGLLPADHQGLASGLAAAVPVRRIRALKHDCGLLVELRGLAPARADPTVEHKCVRVTGLCDPRCPCGRGNGLGMSGSRRMPAARMSTSGGKHRTSEDQRCGSQACSGNCAECLHLSASRFFSGAIRSGCSVRILRHVTVRASPPIGPLAGRINHPSSCGRTLRAVLSVTHSKEASEQWSRLAQQRTGVGLYGLEVGLCIEPQQALDSLFGCCPLPDCLTVGRSQSPVSVRRDHPVHCRDAPDVPHDGNIRVAAVCGIRVVVTTVVRSESSCGVTPLVEFLSNPHLDERLTSDAEAGRLTVEFGNHPGGPGPGPNARVGAVEEFHAAILQADESAPPKPLSALPRDAWS